MFKLLDVLFGCTHKRYTFPITKRGRQRSAAAALTGTYVVCLDCGKEFPYDWHQMKVVSLTSHDRGVIRDTAPEVAKRAA
jgi:hypothetical protein